MAITIYKILLAGIAAVVFIVLLSGGIFYYDSPQVATQLNATAFVAGGAYSSNVFNPINNTAFGGANHTSGLFANVNVFTGAAFVFGAIGQVGLSLLNAPRTIIYLIATPLGILGWPISSIALLLSLFAGLLIFIVVIVLISSWQKYNLREG